MIKKAKTDGRAKSFTIDRAKWLQGGLIKRNPEIYSTLKDDLGRMCCLGFYSEACGVTDMGGNYTPMCLPYDEQDKLDSHFRAGLNESVACGLMSLNDDTDLTPKKREERVAKKFANIGVKVKFKGKYPY